MQSIQHVCRKGILKQTQRLIQMIYQGISCNAEPKTAGIIIIGNEILKAQVQDTNSYFICKYLYDSGVKVEKISVIGDDVDEIVSEIKHFSQTYSHVITTGGIGPTHDDVTFEAVAKAFDDTLHFHPKLVEVVQKYLKIEDLNSPAFKLACVPKNASLKYGILKETGQRLEYPCINMKNVYIFPGSPYFLERSFESLCEKLFATGRSFAKMELLINAREEVFANALTEVSQVFPHVTFGSYPEFDKSDYKARVTIESNSESETLKAKEKFCSLIPTEILVKTT